MAPRLKLHPKPKKRAKVRIGWSSLKVASVLSAASKERTMRLIDDVFELLSQVRLK